MGHYLIIIFILCSFSISAVAQDNSIEGTVADPNGPLELVSVAVENTSIGTVTNETGYFRLAEIPEGEVTLVFSHVGYQKLTQNLNIGNSESREINVILRPNLNQLNEMVITGTRTEKDKGLAAVNVSVLDKKILESTQSNSLVEGLNFQTGLRVEVDCQTCNYTQLRINGLGGAYSQLLINNRPVFSSMMGLYGLEQISTSMIEKVEVIKGGGSALYGSNAVGGTVNIITREPEKDEISLGIEGGLIGNQTPDLNFNGLFTKVFDNSGITLFSSGRNRDVYDHNGDGFSEIPRINNLSLGLKGFVKPGKYSKLNVDFFNIREYRRGGNKNDSPPHLADQSEERDHTIYVGGMDYSLSLPDIRSHLNVFAAAQNTNRRHYTGIDGVDGYGTTENYTYNTGFQWNYYLKSTTFTLGLDYMTDYIFDQIPFYNYLIDQTTHQLGIFSQADWSLSDKLTVLAGVRADRHNYVDDIVINPRINIRYQLLDNIQFRTGYSTGFRAPQAFDSDLHIAFAGGGISFIRLEPDLQMERSESYTGSLTYDNPGRDYIYGFTLEGFYTELKDAFILEQAGLDDQGNIILEKRNGTGSQVYGVNLEGRINYKYIIEASAGYTLQESYYNDPVQWSENIEGIREYLRTPDHYGFYTIQINPAPNIHLNLSGTITGSMKVPHFGGAPGVEEDRIETSPVFWNNNIKITRDFTLSGGKSMIELFGGIQNTWNSYQNDFDTGKNRDSNYVYGPAEPRAFFLGIQFKTL